MIGVKAQNTMKHIAEAMSPMAPNAAPALRDGRMCKPIRHGSAEVVQMMLCLH